MNAYKGTIQFMSFEAGFYGIVTDNNLKFLPVNLKNEYKQDGAVITFTGKLLKDIKTIEQWGSPFEIKDIQIIKPGNIALRSHL